MKNLVRTVLTLMVCFVVCSFLSPTALAETIASGASGDNLNWTLDNEGTLFISGYGDMTSSDGWSEHIESINTIVIEQGAAETVQEAAEQAKNDAGAAAESVGQSDAQIETNKQDIGELRSAVIESLNGTNRTVSIPIGSKVYAFKVLFIKHETYTFLNNTSAACTLAAVQADGTRTQLSTNLLPGKTVEFSPENDNYVEFVGWFNGTGTVEIKSDFSLLDGITEKHLDQFLYGVNSSFDITNSSAAYFFPIYLIKGKSYNFVNNTSNTCTLEIRKGKFDTSFTIIGQIPSGASYNFVVPDEGYNYIGGWFNGTGTFTITSDFSGLSANEKLMSLLRWHDGNVYLGINGVPHGTGLVMPNFKDAYLDGYTVLFEDDFDGSSLDTDVWEYELGYKRNNEPQVYQSENITVKNSNLIITAIREHVQAMKGDVLTDFHWTSGSVIYRNNLDFDRVEAKILFPRKSGAFPGFWGVGTIGDYPECGEIDIVEGMCYEPAFDRVNVGAFYGDQNGNLKSVGQAYANMFDQNGYHVYSLERQEDNLIFLIDGIVISKIEITSEMSEFNNPYNWILNLALSTVSSRIPEDVNEYRMYVDWFRIYSRD